MSIAKTFAPLTNKPFRYQFLAQLVSMTGSTLAPVAMAFGVLEATGSGTTLGIVMGAQTVPMLILILVGGVLADRIPRRMLMITADLVRCVAQVAFGALLVTDHAVLWILIIIQLFNGAARGVSRPTVLGLTSETVPAGHLQQANALIAITRDTTGIVGPLIAGVLAIWFNPGWILILDGATYVLSAWLMSRLKLPLRPSRKQPGFLHAFYEGWREVVRRDWIWSSILYFAFFNFGFAMLLVIGPARLATVPDGSLRWGAVMAALSVGGLAGNMMALRARPRRLLLVPRVLELLAVPMVVALALNSPLAVLACFAFLMGAVMTFPDALWFTALQQEVQPDALSRVSSFDHLGSSLLQPIGFTVGGLLMGLGTELPLILVAAILSCTILLSLAVPGMRTLVRQPVEEESRAQASVA